MAPEGGEAFDGRALPPLCEKIFGSGGYASILPNFEYRPEQERMAYCCAQAFSGNSPLLFEAGTGVGKSMAYLVPGIIAAKRFKRQLVVATHTIALQQQIMEKDLPRISMMFSNCVALSDCADFKAALLLGRANYLCPHRLKRALAEKRELFDTAESAELERIAAWAETTRTGLAEELNPPPDPEVWSWVNADSSSCAPKNCSDGSCFYQNARRGISSADIVVLNHNLLFSLLSAGMGAGKDESGVLFANDMLVIDEAHLIPDVASDAFGLSISGPGIRRELSRIYDPRKKRGLIARSGLAEFRDKQIVCDAIGECEELFAKIKKDFLLSRDTVRLSSPDWADVSGAVGALDSTMRLLDTLAQNAPNERLASEIKDYRRKVSGIKNAIEDCAYLSDPDSVYWLEAAGAGGRSASLNSAPIDVSGILRRVLFSGGSPVILTSATLAISGSMEDFAGKIGAETAESFVCDSPFDYGKNMRAFLFSAAAAPDSQTGKMDCEKTAAYIGRLANVVRGGTLALFTSRADLKRTAEILEASGALKGRRLYVQGRMPRAETVRKFAEDANAVLMGTDTFWTGIDVPGDALSQVIIVRLPFENFKHPLTEARMERAEALGENPFVKISLPAAIIKFRQGIGRLIRSARDRGIVCVLDPRMLTKSYGKNFAAAIPTPRVERARADEIETFVKEEADYLFSPDSEAL